MDKSVYMMGVAENMVTVVACAGCVVGLAYFAEGVWGWGFLILINLNTFGSKS